MAPRVIAGILCLYILLLSGNPLSAGFLLFQTALSDSQSLETNGENKMKEQLEKLFNHNSLSFTETQDAFSEIFEGKVDPVVLGSFLTALKMNGYSADEIGGAAKAIAARQADAGGLSALHRLLSGRGGCGSLPDRAEAALQKQ